MTGVQTCALPIYDEALNFIPELKKEEDEEGRPFYTYTPESGVTKRLEELDKAMLIKLFNRVSTEMNRLNNERLMKQLEQTRQAQQAGSAQPPMSPTVVTPPRIPSPPLQPPRIHTPPNVVVPHNPPKMHQQPKAPPPQPMTPPSVPTVPAGTPRR